MTSKALQDNSKISGDDLKAKTLTINYKSSKSMIECYKNSLREHFIIQEVTTQTEEGMVIPWFHGYTEVFSDEKCLGRKIISRGDTKETCERSLFEKCVHFVDTCLKRADPTCAVLTATGEINESLLSEETVHFVIRRAELPILTVSKEIYDKALANERRNMKLVINNVKWICFWGHSIF